MIDKTYLIDEKISTLRADLVTPVRVYLSLRDLFPGTCLLESADYQTGDNCSTYIGVDPIADFRATGLHVDAHYPDGSHYSEELASTTAIAEALDCFIRQFKASKPRERSVANGFFGYISYEAIKYFEDIELHNATEPGRQIPEINYRFYRFVIAVNHYRNEMYLIENHFPEDATRATQLEEQREKLLKAIYRGHPQSYSFKRKGEARSNFTDSEHAQMIASCKEHIFKGDIFQIVPSRRFAQDFEGDEFQVYRALRNINPSPFLFFFDFGNFKLFGSSPEAELIIKSGKASVYPIAGTYPRNPDKQAELESVERLKADPKENAEHVMLVDLARNDLTKHCYPVEVERYREVHYYSHVIHLVSKVSGQMESNASAVKLLGDTFPAGTLSGAPKHRAMQLIDRYERGGRSFYGGAIGVLDLNGDCVHAIMIRSFLSKGGTLYRQAGGGVVAESVLESEVQEVKNKLGALQAALIAAEEI